MVPDIFFFNPTCEPAIANGSPYYTAPARLRQFESDLGYLPAWVGEEKDLVLVQGNVDHDYNTKLKQLGFRLPEIVNLNQALSDEDWINCPKGRFLPWGWSPAMYHLVRNLLPNCNEAFRQSPVAEWKTEHKKLYSRLTALTSLEKLLKHHQHDWLPDPPDLPVVCHSLESVHLEIDRYLNTAPAEFQLAPADLQSAGAIFPAPISPKIISKFPNFQISQLPKLVVKLPWSSSGRGLLLFPNPDSAKKNDEVLSGMLNQQGFVTVEPWHDKVVDISYQFEASAGKISYKGRTFLENDPKGRYLRNFLTEDIDIQDDVLSFLQDQNDAVVALLAEALRQSKFSSLYEGWIGVDAIIYRNENGQLKFHPMLEINGRFTMGAIALKLRKHLAIGSTGFLQIFYSKTSNFQAFCQKQESEKPLIMKDHQILSGFLPLTPPSKNHHFGAFLEVKSPPPNCS